MIRRAAPGLWVPLYGWAALILVLTSLPGTAVPEVGVTGWDKAAHAFVYAVLSLLLYRYLRRGYEWEKRRCAITTLGLVALFAFFDELHQIPIPFRFCSWQDWCADIVGAGAGCFFALRHFHGETRHGGCSGHR